MNYGLYDTNELYGPGGLVGQFFTYIVTGESLSCKPQVVLTACSIFGGSPSQRPSRHYCHCLGNTVDGDRLSCRPL